MPPRLFTVDQANALLPELTPILVALREQKATIDADRRTLARIMPGMRRNGHGAEAVRLETEIAELAARIQAAVADIRQRGIEVKDLDLGLIDFPSMRQGRIVYLCWRLGEERIQFWHELDSGFAGRQPL